MQITFFIGNGFDRAMRLHTSYADFYRYCVEEITSRERKNNSFLNDFMEALKEDEPNEFSNWADLEQKIGNYMPFPITDDNVKRYERFHEEIGNKLIEYLKCENERVDLSGLKGDRLNENLGIFLEDNDIICPKGEKIKLAFIVYNYTDVFKNIIEESRLDGYDIVGVLNVHGSIEGRSVVFGIGSATDDSVKGWSSLSDVSRKKIEKCLLKEEMLSNKKLCPLREKAIKWVQESDYIISFGASIGATDYFWWKYVTQTLRSRDCQFLVDRFTKELPKQAGHEKDEEEVTKIMQVLLKEKTGKEEYDRIKNKIHIKWNSSIFSGLGVTRSEPNNGIRYEDFLASQKILLLMPVKGDLLSSKDEEIRSDLESLCDDKKIITKLPMESIPKCKENNGKKRIYYTCIKYDDEKSYRTISRLLDIREDGLQEMHIDNIIMLMDYTDPNTGLEAEELEMVINNIEWYAIRKLGKEWRKHFLFVLGRGKKTSSKKIEEMKGILLSHIQNYIDKYYTRESIYVASHDKLDTIVRKSIKKTQSKRGVTIIY